jgi:hypothetical protein
MPNLDEYYHLLRTQSPPLGTEAIRASIRAAVERTGAEVLSETFGESLSETLSKTLAESSSAEVVAEAATVGFEASTNVANTLLSSGIVPVFGSVLAPLITVLTVTALLVLGFVVWRGQQSSEQVLGGSSNGQTYAEGGLREQSAEQLAQGRLEEVSESKELLDPNNRTQQLSKDTLGKYSIPFQNDNTEELYPTIPEPTQHKYVEQAPHFDAEMNEQERHLDSLTIKSFRAPPKRDAAHQRQYDLLMQLVQRAREQASIPKTQARGTVPCSLPAALRGESSVDCILTMLEQQALLLSNNDLVHLTQQARREKSGISLNALEIYIREHF